MAGGVMASGGTGQLGPNAQWGLDIHPSPASGGAPNLDILGQKIDDQCVAPSREIEDAHNVVDGESAMRHVVVSSGPTPVGVPGDECTLNHPGRNPCGVVVDELKLKIGIRLYRCYHTGTLLKAFGMVPNESLIFGRVDPAYPPDETDLGKMCISNAIEVRKLAGIRARNNASDIYFSVIDIVRRDPQYGDEPVAIMILDQLQKDERSVLHHTIYRAAEELNSDTLKGTTKEEKIRYTYRAIINAGGSLPYDRWLNGLM
jgi:hypothetical protein